MGILYADGGKIFCSDYLEIYIPIDYLNSGLAVNTGSSVETLGIVYCRSFTKGTEGPIKFINLPAIVNFMVYEFRNDEKIVVNGLTIDVLTLCYTKDSYVLHQTIVRGREVSELFLKYMLNAKIPKSIPYSKLIDIWWRNLEIAGVNYKVPSKILEIIIASIYRNKNNTKERFGKIYGKSTDSNEFGYKAENVRNVVKNLSTFSGMVFEDMGLMISNGINNSADEIQEPVSPLEKIIHY